MPTIKGKIEKLSKFKAQTKWGEKDKWSVTIEGKQITGWGELPEGFKQGEIAELEYEQKGEYFNYIKPQKLQAYDKQEYQERKDIIMSRMSAIRASSDLAASDKKADLEYKEQWVQKFASKAEKWIATGIWQ